MTQASDDKVRTDELLEREARELLAQAHEPRRHLVAVDIRSGNIGGHGVRWVEIETALTAIRAALRSRAATRDTGVSDGH